MNLATLAITGLRDSRLTHALNILLLALGLGTVVLLILFSGALSDRVKRDAGGIDLVVGAKGSPLQLVLSTVFQTDIPTGNIPLADAQELSGNPLVDKAVPMALGDAVASFRIIGTTPDYLDLFGAKLAEGRLWQQPMEAVLGADVARRLDLRLGDHFVGAHGVTGAGDLHSHFPYLVTGILAPTGSLIDRVVLTPVESVWKVHEGHHHDEEDMLHLSSASSAGGGEHGERSEPGGHDERDEHDGHEAPREVTALLLRFKTPLAMVTLPHEINARTGLQAAVPSMEIARLFSLVGFGLEVFRALAGILIASAGLGVFVTLYSRFRAREQELAVLRLLGASRPQLFATVLLEALLLSGLGALAGLALGHGAAWILTQALPQGHALANMDLGWRQSEWVVPVLALGVGTVAALVPGITAYRSDVSRALTAALD